MLSKLPPPAVCAPGASRYNWESWRPLSGNVATSRELTFAPTAAELVSTRVNSPPDTCTSVVTDAGCRLTFRVRSWPTLIGTPVAFHSARPGVWMETLYVDEAKLGT